MTPPQWRGLIFLLSDLRQDLRERSDSQYSFVDNLASSIDFTPVQRYVTQYYLLFPCVNRPELIGLNETYFGSLKRAVETDILQWRSKNNRARGQDVFRFCDEEYARNDYSHSRPASLFSFAKQWIKDETRSL